MITKNHISRYKEWQSDWNKFARDVLRVNLDREQQEILQAVQTHKMVSVRSGTSRGKDFVAAVAAVCFMYLTPSFNERGELVENTKVIMTAPTSRQVRDIMFSEVSRLFHNAKVLPGRLVGNDIRTMFDEWFLTGFKAEDNAKEAWTGYHAANIMFVVTEASGMPELIFESIEGNLQGNSRLLIVFNPNTTIGYAAESQKKERFKKFTLSSLSSPNVLAKKIVIPGQVDYEWLLDKIDNWCIRIEQDVFDEGEGDFCFEENYYRPNDLFRVKVLGMFPRMSEDTLIPIEWVERANARWVDIHSPDLRASILKIGNDVAGMGVDDTVYCFRYDDYVQKFKVENTTEADHMQIAGTLCQYLSCKDTYAFIDTIGEGAGVYSRLREQRLENAISAKASEGASDYSDETGEREFVNMRAYMFWAVRDWLNPKHNHRAALPPDNQLLEELTTIKYKIQSNGKILIEPKEEIKKKIKRSPGKADALALTFYPQYQVTNVFEVLNAFK